MKTNENTCSTQKSEKNKGNVSNIMCNLTSGKISLDSSTAPEKIEVDLTSGNVKLNIPENDGFTLSFDSTVGTVRSDFALSGTDDMRIYKNGEKQYRVDLTSGSLTLQKKS